MKRLLLFALIITLIISTMLCGCNKNIDKNIIQCSNCGVDIELDSTSTTENEATAVFCKDCNEELFGSFMNPNVE